MYGGGGVDCQVLVSSMAGGGGGNSDSNNMNMNSIFGSIQNPNNMINSSTFNFINHNSPFNNIFSSPINNINIIPKEENGGMSTTKSNKDEFIESGSGSEHMEGGGGGGVSGNEQDFLDAELLQQQQPANKKKKRYHRHTARQIQEMEGLFKECPHPDDKQRLKLSQELGLKPRQVKFWFQNRRTQLKAQQDRQDNVVLRNENESLKKDNYRLQAALRNIVCPNCGGPAILGEMGSYDDQQLRIENARLKEELDRVCCMVTQYTGRPLAMGPSAAGSFLGSSLDLDISSYPRKFDDHNINNQINNANNCLPPPPHDNNDDHLIPAADFMPDDNHNAQFPAGMIMEEEKPLAMDLAILAIDELLKLCHTDKPLWNNNNNNNNNNPVAEKWEALNLEEYARMFPNWKQQHAYAYDPQLMIRNEATRDTAVVIMNSITLVDAFLDANKWMELFPSIISRAKTLQVVHSGINNGSHAITGSLYLMYAELQVLSPLVPTRETHFFRYCQHNAEEGSWAIVDFPVDASGSFQNMYSSTTSPAGSFPYYYYYRRRPSGCVIQDMPNGYSRVTWVEHSELVEDGRHIHQLFNQLVNSGLAFGAPRWLAVLQRQCERLASLMARNISDLGVIPSPQARKNLMNLAQRMIRTFCLNIGTCYGQSWTALSDSAADTVRISTRKVSEPGQPNGLILSAVSTTWLPYPHHQVFDFLRDERRRAQLEVVSNGNPLHEVAHIANGSHPGNCISLLRINVASNSSQSVELVLQESCSDDSGSIVVYTTIDVDAVQLAMNGEDPSCIPLLPLGFVIIPLIPTKAKGGGSNSEESKDNNNNNAAAAGCLLTTGLQVLASTIPTAKLSLSSVTAINHHLCNTTQQINAALAKPSCCTSNNATSSAC